MEFNLFNRKKQTVIVFVVIVIILAVIITTLQPFKYNAKAKLLIIQDFSGNMDPYAMARSNQYIGSLLANIVPSYSFYKEVMNSGFKIDQTYFDPAEGVNKELKAWEKTVEAKPSGDSGMLEINVYHTDRYQAEQLIRAINFTLMTKNQQYHGGGDNITVKVIDDPMISDWPVKPNILLNLGLALIFGLCIALAYIFIFPESQYDLHLMPKADLTKGSEMPYPSLNHETYREQVVMSKPVQETVRERPLSYEQAIREQMNERSATVNNQQSNNNSFKAPEPEKKISFNGNMRNILQ